MKAHKAKTWLLAAGLLTVTVCAGNIPAQAQTFTTIYTFTGKGANGEYPSGNLAFDSNGTVYGTTSNGGSGNYGIVYQLVPPAKQGAWTENVIYTFLGGADGQSPSGLVFDQNGNLYGTTYHGGISQNTNCGQGCGTVYKLSPPAQTGGAWTHTVLYAFQGDYDGQYPQGVTFGSNSSLYGTTQIGGAAGFYFSCVGYPNRNDVACGEVFQLTPPTKKGGSWTKTILYSFPSYAGDGQHPYGDLTFDSLSNIYGTAGGGTSAEGIAFQLVPAKGNGSAKETVLHEFTGGSDGGYPGGGLALGANGQLFGVAQYGGASGLVFELAQSNGTWTETVLYNFPGFSGDGTNPASTPILDSNGNLYGLTANGGTAGGGIVFKLAPPSGSGGWTETVLYNFPSGQGGPPVVFRNGLLYGTAATGGSGLGSVFTLTP